MVDSSAELSAARERRQEWQAQRHAVRVHALGPRVFFELLAEIARSLDADDIVFATIRLVKS